MRLVTTFIQNTESTDPDLSYLNRARFVLSVADGHGSDGVGILYAVIRNRHLFLSMTSGAEIDAGSVFTEDDLPVASDSRLGIAAFDPAYFSILAGKVSLRGDLDFGLNETQLAEYLTANKYATQAWVAAQGFIGSDGLALYATKEWVLGQNFAKASSLGNYLPKPTWDAVFEVVTVDGTPALKVKYDILGLKGITAYADGSLSGGFSGALVDLVDVAVTNLASGDILKYNGTHFVNVPVSSIAGASSWDQITGKPEYYPTRWADVSGAPTSLPASDVYPWAKAVSKPTYTAAEVGAVALNGGGNVSGSINASAYLTANTLRAKAALYPTISFVKTNDNSESLLIVAGNNLYYRPVASDATNRLVYHSGNFNPSSKLDKSVWDEAFELKTVDGVRVISAKLDFLSVAGISAYATGPSSGGGGGGLDYDLLKQALTGAITPDGYPFTISASFLGAIGNTYLPLSGGTLTNTGNSAPLIITGSSLQACTKYMMNGSTVSGYFGVVAQGLNGAFMQYANGTISPSLIINNDAAPRFINTAGTQFILYHSGNFNPDSKFPYLGMGGVNDNSNEIGAGYSGSSAGGNFNGPFIKFGQTSNYMTELYNRHDQDVFQIRRMVNGEWQAFVNLWHSGNFNPDNYLPLTGNKTITGSLTVANGFTSGIMKCQTGVYPQLQFEQTNTGVTSILFVQTNNALIYRPVDPGSDYTVYHSGNFNPDNYLLKTANAVSASKWATARTLTLTGSASGNVSMDGSANVSLSVTNNRLNSNSEMTYGWNGINYFNLAGTAGAAAKINDTPTTAWWHILRFNHGNSAGYYTDLAVPFNDNTLYYKRVTSGTLQNGGWVKIWDEKNANLSTVDWAAKNITAAGTVTATKLVIGGITIDVYNGALRVNGNLVATGGVTAYQ